MICNKKDFKILSLVIFHHIVTLIQVSKPEFLSFFGNIIWVSKLLTLDQIKVFIEIYHCSKFHFWNCGETYNMSIINQIFPLVLLILLQSKNMITLTGSRKWKIGWLCIMQKSLMRMITQMKLRWWLRMRSLFL